MGLDFTRKQPAPAPAAPQQDDIIEVTDYSIEDDRKQLEVQYVNSPEVDALASQIEIYNLDTIVSFGAPVADEISKASDVVLNSMNMAQLDNSSEMLNILAKIMEKFDVPRRVWPAATCASSWTRFWPNIRPWAMR